MIKLVGLLLASSVGLASIGAVSAASMTGPVLRIDPPQSAVEQIQGRYCARLRYECENGERGDGNCRRYRQECGGGEGRYNERQDYGRQPKYRPDLCSNWQRQCANLYGSQTRAWQQCMNQPGAVRDCSR